MALIKTIINGNNRDTLDWLQSLRGIAALAVVICHSRSFFKGSENWNWADRWLISGAIGVDLFFILSGFIMVYSTVDSDGSAAYVKKFFIKRFARIWPVYAVITLAWVIMMGRGIDFFSTVEKFIIFIKSLLFFPAIPSSPLYFGTALPVGWSLNFEIYFYLIFGLCILFGRFRWVALVAWMFTSLVVLPYWSGDLSWGVWHNYQYSMPYFNLMANPIIVEFLVGLLIGIIYIRKEVRFKRQNFAYFLIVSSISFAIWNTINYQGSIHGFFGWGWPIAVMVLCIAIASKTVTFRICQPFVRLGEISYSLYLIHGFVHAIAKVSIDRLGLHSYINTFVVIFATTVLSIYLATLSHKYLERGLSEVVRNWMLNGQWPVRRASTEQ